MHRRLVLRIALVSFLSSLLLPATAWAQEDIVTVASPDGRIVFRLLDGPPPTPDTQLPHLAYQVDFDGKALIQTSYLGFELYNQVPLGQKLGLVRTHRDAVDETYTLPGAQANPIRNHHNEVIAEYLQNGSLGRMMTLEVRAFNDGVAFRYVVPPSPPLLEMRIENELTEFHFARDGTAYPLVLRGFQTDYADEYQKRTLSGIHPESLVALPFLVEQPGVGWVAVTEADIEDYSGLYLTHEEGRRMRARLAPRVDGLGLSVFVKTPMVTPWRVLLIADQPEKLIESNLVANLAPPTKLTDLSWVRSGKLLPTAAQDAEVAIGFAGQYHIESVLLREDWATPGRSVPDLLRPAIDLPAVLASAKANNVGVWLAAPWRAVESQMDEAFAQFEQWGVAGVRMEGMRRDDQDMVAFLRSVAAKAAEHRLMLSFDGAYKPDGLRRTFPNLMTQTAALTSEHAEWGARVTPDHNVMLAFARLLAGPLDYAPGGFRNTTPSGFQPGMTLSTRAHQLALFVVFDSPVQRLAGDPGSYSGQREFEFVQAVPVTWDETRAVAGEVGAFVAVARRSGSEWYLGAITNGSAREIDVPLTFLGAGEFVAEVYADAAEQPQSTSIDQRRVRTGAVLRLKLAPGGGAAVRFHPAN